jgi:hypothetical protein
MLTDEDHEARSDREEAAPCLTTLCVLCPSALFVTFVADPSS